MFRAILTSGYFFEEAISFNIYIFFYKLQIIIGIKSYKARSSGHSYQLYIDIPLSGYKMKFSYKLSIIITLLKSLPSLDKSYKKQKYSIKMLI